MEESDINGTNTTAQKDEFSEILGSHFNLDSMVRETGNYIFYYFKFSSIFAYSNFYFYFYSNFYNKNRMSSKLNSYKNDLHIL